MRYLLSSRYDIAYFNTRFLSLLLREAISCSHGAYELALGVLCHQNLLGRAQAVGAARFTRRRRWHSLALWLLCCHDHKAATFNSSYLMVDKLLLSSDKGDLQIAI